LSGFWLDMDLRRDMNKMCLQEIGLSAQNLLTILGSIVSINMGTYVIT